MPEIPAWEWSKYPLKPCTSCVLHWLSQGMLPLSKVLLASAECCRCEDTIYEWLRDPPVPCSGHTRHVPYLSALLTVRAHHAASHGKLHLETFTDAGTVHT